MFFKIFQKLIFLLKLSSQSEKEVKVKVLLCQIIFTFSNLGKRKFEKIKTEELKKKYKIKIENTKN